MTLAADINNLTIRTKRPLDVGAGLTGRSTVEGRATGHLTPAKAGHLNDPDSRNVMTMASNEKTGKGVGSIASRGMRDPGSLTNREIKAVSASAMTQRPDNKGGGKKK